MSGTVEPYVRFTCHACHARLKVEAHQAGAPIRCPNCRVRLVVPHDSLDLQAARVSRSPRPPEGKLKPQTSRLVVYCPTCGARVELRSEEVGGVINCPDCALSFVIPRPSDGPASIGTVTSCEDDLQVSAPLVRPKVEVFDYAAELEESSAAGPAAPRRRIVYEVPARPRYLFFSGVWSFPFYPDTAVRWFALSVAGSLFPIMVMHAIQLGSSHNAILWAEALVLSAFSVLVGTVWTAYCCVVANTIAVETAAGNDRIVQWPDMMFMDWIVECFYVFNAVCVCAGLAVGLLRGLEFVGLPDWGLMAAASAAFLIFPLTILSMLEAGSPLNIVNRTVLRSVVVAWRGWCLFYFLTGVLILAATASTLGVISLLPRDPSFWLIAGLTVIASTAAVAVMILYFRLLGRLALYCAEVIVLPLEVKPGADAAAEPSSEASSE